MQHVATEALLDYGQTQGTSSHALPAKQQKQQKYHNAYNDRMAGSVPSYDAPSSRNTRTFEDVLSNYAPQEDVPTIEYGSKKAEKFGFLDILDMVNPLQHIPLVNLGYRAITGDEIKPVSKVVGGAVFGGPAGAAVGIVDAIVETETGRDVIDTATAFAGGGSIQQTASPDDFTHSDFSVALLSKSPTPLEDAEQALSDVRVETSAYQRAQFAQGRTAGTIAVFA